MEPYLTVPELARRLRVSARKVYDLVERNAIPHTRAGARLLFAPPEIDAWLARSHRNAVPGAAPGTQLPAPVVCGSHDPLFAWAARASGSGLAMLSGGSRDGLLRMQRVEACAALTHLPSADLREFNVAEVERRFAGRGMVLIGWAWRDQGLVVAPGNPKKLREVGDMVRRDVRCGRRGDGAGTRVLLDTLLAREHHGSAGAGPAWKPALDDLVDEDEVALAILAGRIDCGLGLRSVAASHGLDFVPVCRERIDLLIDRRSYFEPPLQTLMSFTRARAFRQRAAEMGGYDLGCAGDIIWNG